VIRRAAWTVLAGGLLAAGLVTIHAIDLPRAVILVIVLLAVSLTLGLAPAIDEPWPNPAPERRAGGRTDVSELAWAAYTRDGMITERVLRRVRRCAAQRLATHGVLWDARPGDGTDGWGHDDSDALQHRDRAAELLGPALLTALAAARTVAPRTLESWLRALDTLVVAPDDARRPS
jgi:hypothetical protein